MKNGSDQWQVDDDLLTETGRGGLFTDGYLQGRPLVSYLESSETPLFVFGSGKGGITRVNDDETSQYVPDSGYRAIIALTDRRLQFVVGGGGPDGDWAADVHLSTIEAVSVEEGLIRDRLSITTEDADWQVTPKDVDTDTLVEFLEEISWAWIQVEEHLGEARKHLVDATRRYNSWEYEAAQEELLSAREHLNEAKSVEDDLARDATAGIRERIQQVETRYRETKRRAHASEATRLVDNAEEHWREEEYERAYEAFDEARSVYRAAVDIPGLDPEKAGSLHDRIEHVEQNLEHLRAAPLERAARSRRRALGTEDPAERVDAWSETLERYRTVLELDWGRDERRFAGDVDRTRDRLVEAVEGILDARRDLATECRARGDELVEAGEFAEARDQYSEAASHLEAGLDVARELAPGETESLEDRLDELADRIGEATERVTETESDATEDRYDDFDNWVTLSPSGDGSDGRDDAGSPATGTGHPSRAADGAGGPIPDTDVDPEPVVPSESADPALVAAIEALAPRSLSSVIAAVWDERGWQTVETDSDDTVVATRGDSQRRVLVAAPSVTPITVERARQARDEHAADDAVLVVAETSAESVESVTFHDAESLARLVEENDLVSLLQNVAV